MRSDLFSGPSDDKDGEASLASEDEGNVKKASEVITNNDDGGSAPPPVGSLPTAPTTSVVEGNELEDVSDVPSDISDVPLDNDDGVNGEAEVEEDAVEENAERNAERAEGGQRALSAMKEKIQTVSRVGVRKTKNSIKTANKVLSGLLKKGDAAAAPAPGECDPGECDERSEIQNNAASGESESVPEAVEEGTSPDVRQQQRQTEEIQLTLMEQNGDDYVVVDGSWVSYTDEGSAPATSEDADGRNATTKQRGAGGLQSTVKEQLKMCSSAVQSASNAGLRKTDKSLKIAKETVSGLLKRENKSSTETQETENEGPHVVPTDEAPGNDGASNASQVDAQSLSRDGGTAVNESCEGETAGNDDGPIGERSPNEGAEDAPNEIAPDDHPGDLLGGQPDGVAGSDDANRGQNHNSSDPANNNRFESYKVAIQSASTVGIRKTKNSIKKANRVLSGLIKKNPDSSSADQSAAAIVGTSEDEAHTISTDQHGASSDQVLASEPIPEDASDIPEDEASPSNPDMIDPPTGDFPADNIGAIGENLPSEDAQLAPNGTRSDDARVTPNDGTDDFGDAPASADNKLESYKVAIQSASRVGLRKTKNSIKKANRMLSGLMKKEAPDSNSVGQTSADADPSESHPGTSGVEGDAHGEDSPISDEQCSSTEEVLVSEASPGSEDPSDEASIGQPACDMPADNMGAVDGNLPIEDTQGVPDGTRAFPSPESDEPGSIGTDDAHQNGDTSVSADNRLEPYKVALQSASRVGIRKTKNSIKKANKMLSGLMKKETPDSNSVAQTAGTDSSGSHADTSGVEAGTPTEASPTPDEQSASADQVLASGAIPENTSDEEAPPKNRDMNDSPDEDAPGRESADANSESLREDAQGTPDHPGEVQDTPSGADSSTGADADDAFQAGDSSASADNNRLESYKVAIQSASRVGIRKTKNSIKKANKLLSGLIPKETTDGSPVNEPVVVPPEIRITPAVPTQSLGQTTAL